MKIVISVYLTYHQYDTIYLVLNLDQAEQNIVWLSIFQLMVKLGCDNRSKQKRYCKSYDPHWCLQKYCELCYALTSISMSKRTTHHTRSGAMTSSFLQFSIIMKTAHINQNLYFPISENKLQQFLSKYGIRDTL